MDEDSDRTDDERPGVVRRRVQVGRVLCGSSLLLAGAAAVSSRLGQTPLQPGEGSWPMQVESKIGIHRLCSNIWGVQVAEPEDKTSIWGSCSAKWTEDCTHTGCCSDKDMTCFQKNQAWASCKETCTHKVLVDGVNESWTCEALEPATPRTPEQCFEECKGKGDCQQAVYSGDGGGSCRLAKSRVPKVAWAADNVNSTFCGGLAEMGEVKHAVDHIWTQIPFQMEWPIVNCSWGGEDCSQTKCCNDYWCDKNYENCNGFTCFKKTQYFSGCSNTVPKGWDGQVEGGARERRVVPPAGSQVAVQGSSLYCFTVVLWTAPAPKPFWNSEKELADNWKTKGIHVMQCDGHEILDGVATPKAEWGSFSNIDMFMSIWAKIKAIGRWKDYDWTVKVDSDAVFLPNRLKDHLFKLRTPRGARVYLENIDYKFKFMGAIEVLTREAVAQFLERGHECIRGDHEGGEDSFLKGCMDGIGVDHQSDYHILRDKYAGQDDLCIDGWYVAYHYYKKTHSWSKCYNQAVCGWNDLMTDGGTDACDEAIEVPHPPGWGAGGPAAPPAKLLK